MPANSSPETPNTSVHQMTLVPSGKLPDGPPPVLPDPVVATVTVTEVGELPVTLTDAGTVQIGAGTAVGVTLHARFTVPLNDPAGLSARLKVAVCPAEMVCELDPPEAGAKVKSGTAVAVPDRPTS